MKRELIMNVKAIPLDKEEKSGIDRGGFLSALAAVKAKGTGDLTVKVQHCDTLEGEYADVPDPYLIVKGGATVKNVVPDDLVNFDIDLVGCKQYIKVSFEGNGLGDAAPSVVVLGDAAETPIGGAGLGE